LIDNYYLHSIDGRFVAEAHYGQTVISMTKDDINNLKDKSFIHSIKIGGVNKVCATAKTIWRKIESRTQSGVGEGEFHH
jgi:acyl-CoA thioesterase FadM